MQIKMQFLANRFCKKQKTGNLDSAACTASTGTTEGKQYQDRSGYRRPLVKIRSGITGGGDNRTNLEKCLLKCFPHIVKQMPDVESDHQGRSDDHKEVAADLFRFQCLRKLPGEKKKIDIEVYAKQDHKDSDDDLNI